jgi:hypothetical protein
MKMNLSVKQSAQSFSIPERTFGLIESSQVLSVFTSDKGSIQMKLSRRNWWNDGNREEIESPGKKARHSATLPTKLSHGLVQNRKQLSTARDQHPKAVARPA